MAAPALEIAVDDASPVCIVRVSGPVDHARYFELEEAIQTRLDRKRTTMVVDLTALTYISSAGINVLGQAVSQFERLGGRLVLVRPAQPAQWSFFTTIGVDRVFPWADSLEEAVRRIEA